MASMHLSSACGCVEMANRFLESFDHYSAREQKWVNINLGGAGAALFTIGAGAKRTGLNGMAILHAAGANTYNIDVPGLTAKAQYIMGFAWRPTLLPTNFAVAALCRTLDAATIQGALGVLMTGQLTLHRGGASTAALVQSTRAVKVGQWYYVEWKHLVNNGAGILEVRVNGEVWATFAGNTRISAANQATAIGFGGSTQPQIGNKPTWDVDDIYVNDSDGGAPNNGYWGDTQAEARVPSANSPTYQEWTTLVGAATHWQATSEIPPDDVTSYIGSIVADQRDTYTRPALGPAAATINALQVNTRAAVDALAGSFARMYRRAGADSQGGDTALSTTWTYYLETLEQDPLAGPGAWTLANVNAGEFGARGR